MCTNPFFFKKINNNSNLYSVEKNVQELEQINIHIFFFKKITFVQAGTGSARTRANSVQRPPELREAQSFFLLKEMNKKINKMSRLYRLEKEVHELDRILSNALLLNLEVQSCQRARERAQEKEEERVWAREQKR